MSPGPEAQAFLLDTWYVAARDYERIGGKLLERQALTPAAA